MPTLPATPISIIHNELASRFETTVDGQLCVAAYRRSPGVVDLNHTGVPSALGGRGIAAALVHEALTWVAAEGLAVRPSCSYVRVYLRRHPELSLRQAD
ncbi:GNAT family N-acetyltransferase [Sphaerotilus sp.]|uniref:GNAT family N-acetyltransferase n=1 Tax=Sphaerotilus sp. TaxID=2093942 RepID=UPI00286E6E21|nr:GNAT family N-acetyltransferase [Sphaerotilus sp.]